MKYIIIQAGGRGSRLMNLTKNKPKALVPIDGEPLLLKTMKLYPSSHFLIIADYKNDVLERYLKVFATSFKYTVIHTTGKGTISGIRQAVNCIPMGEPFLILWCDLYCTIAIYPKSIRFYEHNYIGLSKNFTCRWSFKNGELLEFRSDSLGVAGVFSFRSKKELAGIPSSGEFCMYLRDHNISFTPFFLKGVVEIGTPEIYNEVSRVQTNTRPFNTLVFKPTTVVKKAITEQGKELMKYEINWYKKVQKYRFAFIPKVKSYRPLTLQRVRGECLFKARFKDYEKRNILHGVITNLRTIHEVEEAQTRGTSENDREAIANKTKKRLDSIASLIPNIHRKVVYINGKKCINFYKDWHIVEKMCKPYLGHNRYRLIHGDPTFSNILYENTTQKIYFIDPRGYYGNILLKGDPDYDWAKVYYSLVGNYDQFNVKNFDLKLRGDRTRINIASNGWEFLGKDFFRAIQRDSRKIKLYHAIIWLSLTTYAWDNYDSILGAFYKGVYLMQKAYEDS